MIMQEYRRTQSANDPVARARYTIMRVQGVVDTLMKWQVSCEFLGWVGLDHRCCWGQVNKQRDRVRRTQRLGGYFKVRPRPRWGDQATWGQLL